jgi:hypothetical protein
VRADSRRAVPESPRAQGRRHIFPWRGDTSQLLGQAAGQRHARPGLRHVAQIHALAGHPGVRLIDHVFSDDQKYVVCLYHLGCKVYRDSDFALVATLVLPYRDTDLVQVDFVQLADTLLLAHPLYPLRQVVRGPAEAWTTAEYEFTAPPQHKHWPDPGTLMHLTAGTFGAGTASPSPPRAGTTTPSSRRP